MELKQVTGLPRASMETCAPPLLSSRISAATSCDRVRIDAGHGADVARQCQLGVVDVDGDHLGAQRLAIMMADSPTPPQPCTATHWPPAIRPWSTTARNEVTKRQPRLAAVTKSIAPAGAPG